MNERKEKSAVGMGVPSAEIEKVSTESITDNSENIKSILEKLTELLQMTRAGKDIFEIVKVNEKAVIVYNHGDMDIVNIECDSGIAVIYDIVKKLM